MRTYTLIALLGLMPLAAVAQVQGGTALSPVSSAPLGLTGESAVLNAATLAVLRANCPKGMPEAEWLKLMEIPANRAVFPLRITQAMLDTLVRYPSDGREMDLRFQYVFIPEQTQQHGPQVR